jgi:uncharacterized protein
MGEPFASLRNVFILLPPSEGKSAPPSGPPVDLAALSFPSLTKTRRQVLTALIRVCRADPQEAAAVLGLGPTQSDEVVANRGLRRRPSGPAITVYSGVLYEALDQATMSPRTRGRLQKHVAISSALWGLVRPDDLIPAYRLSGGVTLPGVGPLTSAWRSPVSATVEAADALIVDLRSSTYAALGPVPRSVADRTVTVRVLQERGGKRTVVSHSNKATKGRIVRSLLDSRRTPVDPDALRAELVRADYRVEQGATRPGRPAVLDVIVDQP